MREEAAAAATFIAHWVTRLSLMMRVPATGAFSQPAPAPDCADPAPKVAADWLEMIWERQVATPDSAAASRPRPAERMGHPGSPLRLVWSRSPDGEEAGL